MGCERAEPYPRNYLSRASAPARRKPVPRRVKESLPDRAPYHRRRLNAIETSRGRIMGTRVARRGSSPRRPTPLCAKAHCRAHSRRRAQPLSPSLPRRTQKRRNHSSYEFFLPRRILITFDPFQPYVKCNTYIHVIR